MKKKTRKSPEMDRGRLAVIDNIERALAEGNSFAKVELDDHVVTEEERARVILPFDCLRRSPIARLRRRIAVSIAERATREINADTAVIGLENLLGVRGGAIIVANHYNPEDSTLIRHAAMLAGRGRELHILAEEGNFFKEGMIGFLLRNTNTLPVCQNLKYLAGNLRPAIAEIMRRGEMLLIYPEEQMWFNYRKPRPHREGAYYYATELSVPVIPMFAALNEASGYDSQGFRSVKRTLYIMPPIYPADRGREGREAMQRAAEDAMQRAYIQAYGIEPSSDFNPSRDIAGYVD